MSEPDAITLEEKKAQVGGEARYSSWYQLTQDRIGKFADVTEDWQFIHVDQERSKNETPFGGTIAHGFLSLSMLSAMSYETEQPIEGAAMGINYGFNKIRFTAPVAAGKKVRGKFTTLSVDEKSPTNVVVTTKVEVEIEGERRPAVIAEWLGLTILGKAADK